VRWFRAAVVPVVVAAGAVGVVVSVVGGVSSSAPVGAAVTASGGYVALAPTRVLDTRYGTGGVAVGALAAHATVVLTVGGVGAVPGGISAAALNVTVTGPTEAGFVTVWPDGGARPATSNVNFGKAQTVPNMVITPVAGNKIDFYNGSSGSVQIIADIFGYYTAGTAADPGTFAAITPARLLDTRSGIGAPTTGPVTAHAHVTLTIPPTDIPLGAAAVVLNVTAAGPTANGFVTVWGDGASQPTTSNVNFVKGQTVPNLVIAPVGSNGKVDLYNGSAGTVQLIADISGYYLAGTPITDDGAYTALPTPARLLDTRNAIGAPKATVPGRGGVIVAVSGQHGIPTTNVAAVVLNVTVTGPTGAGYITTYADGAPRPTTSNVNYTTGQTTPNLVIAPIGTDGRIVLDAHATGTTQLIADIFGYIQGTPQPTWTPTAAAPLGDATAGASAFFNSVACPGAGSCVAVGDYSSLAGGALMSTLASGTWTDTEVPVPTLPASNAGHPSEANLESVACPAVGTCVAVGIAGFSEREGIIATVSGATVTSIAAPVPSNATATNADTRLYSVACPAAGTCVAVGLYIDNTGVRRGLIDTLSAGTWTARQTTVPAGALATQSDVLTSVACPTTVSCAATGMYGIDPGVQLAVADVLATGTWTAISAPLPSGATATTAQPEINSLACPAAGTCVLVGDYLDPAGVDHGLIESLSGTAMTVQRATLPTGVATVANQDAALTGIDCSGVGACVAVGWYNGARLATIDTLASGTWTATTAPLPVNADSSLSVLNTIACPAAGTCTAVGEYIDGVTHLQGLIETLAGGTWTAVTATLPPDNDAANLDVDLEGVACSGDASTCAVVGFYPNSGTVAAGLLDTLQTN
jgi:hypothetical protein